PEFFPLLQGLVNRDQIELMTGGYYEPILPIIPDRDKLGQIRKMTGYLRRRFGVHARGLWLAERVWEPHLPRPLAQAGVEYTIVDDSHFLAAGQREEQLTGHFVTEEEGHTLAIFPSLRRLRYLIPWHPVGEVMEYLHGRADSDEPLLLMGDDGEKFGLWPGTYAHCWEQGWADALFTALEAASLWLRVITAAEALARPAAGSVYLPAASYDEMMEWAGGFWRNFLVKYPEINTMHKRMQRTSEKVWRMPAGRRRQRALDELWQGQCNCPYWHGVFGGVYLPHIRRATFGHLIAAETLADGARTGVWISAGDLDADGAEEIEIASPHMLLVIDPHDGGSITEWQWRAAHINLVNVMTRRPEAYHEALRAPPTGARADAAEVESIHTARIRVKEPDLERLLIYDRYRRAAFVEHFLSAHADAASFLEGRDTPHAEWATRAYAHAIQDRTVALAGEGGIATPHGPGRVRVEKRFTLAEGAPELVVRYRVSNTGTVFIDSVFAVETNWAITDPAAPVWLNAAQLDGRAIHSGEAVERVMLRDTGWSGHIALVMPPAGVWLLPLETVSNSEAGFERILQGITCLARWPLVLPPAQAWECEMRIYAQREGDPC
ncbi:MAG: DUF1926 domain-containing protein, partial [Armatimonadetes bacterium]|nr:DUF1926 domain-containing protein [Armatimonadota bacterium]